MPVPRFIVVGLWALLWLWILVWMIKHPAQVSHAWDAFWHAFSVTTSGPSPSGSSG